MPYHCSHGTIFSHPTGTHRRRAHLPRGVRLEPHLWVTVATVDQSLGSEAEPSFGVGCVDAGRFSSSVGGVEVQSSALGATKQVVPVLIRGDLFHMTEVHILTVSAVVAAAAVHDTSVVVRRPRAAMIGFRGQLSGHSSRVTGR
jgi:hypothetical protein